MIRVLLADDHGVIRDGLGRLIGALDDVELIGTAADGAEAVERARALRPDVILMDLDMPVLDGIEATRRIIAERPDAAVLVLTAFSDRARILGALEAGRAATCSRTSPPRTSRRASARPPAASPRWTRAPPAPC